MSPSLLVLPAEKNENGEGMKTEFIGKLETTCNVYHYSDIHFSYTTDWKIFIVKNFRTNGARKIKLMNIKINFNTEQF